MPNIVNEVSTCDEADLLKNYKTLTGVPLRIGKDLGGQRKACQ